MSARTHARTRTGGETRSRAPSRGARRAQDSATVEPKGEAHVDRPATAAGAGLPLHPRLREWFTGRGWAPHAFQESAWRAWSEGRGGLIHVPTGAGKTYAAYLGPLGSCVDDPPRGLAIVYVTPLRARERSRSLRSAACPSWTIF